MAWHQKGAKALFNQCSVIANWTLRNKLQWNFNQNSKIFIQENASENIVWEMAAILSRGWWVILTPHGLVTPYGIIELGQHWFGRWQQAITWTNVDLSSVGFHGTHLRPISQRVLTVSICKMIFNPPPFWPKGYCRHLRLSVCPSVCLSVPIMLVNTITQSVYPISLPNF